MFSVNQLKWFICGCTKSISPPSLPLVACCLVIMSSWKEAYLLCHYASYIHSSSVSNKPAHKHLHTRRTHAKSDHSCKSVLCNMFTSSLADMINYYFNPGGKILFFRGGVGGGGGGLVVDVSCTCKCAFFRLMFGEKRGGGGLNGGA